MKIPRLLITPGEPAGIGPDIVVRIAQKTFASELVVIADPDLLLERAKAIDLPLQLIECDLQKPPVPHLAQTLKILPLPLSACAKPGELNAANSPYVLQTLERAADLCQKQYADAIVTGPVHKAIMNEAGISFTGHTEFFANYCDVPLTVMLFVVDKLKIALATTHLPLAKVASSITKAHLENILFILDQGLKQQFHFSKPRIAVCGLNPHAGENGYLGREEIEVIEPVIATLNQENYSLKGPYPADTIFTPAALKETDAVLAMYHDQALPLVKYIGFGHAVNVTLGLPFIRTSVDHGTALHIAGTNAVDAGSMAAALELAMKLA